MLVHAISAGFSLCLILIELFAVQEQSVLPMPLALGLDMVMNRPHNVRLMDFPWRGKGTGLPSRTGKKRKGSSRSAA